MKAEARGLDAVTLGATTALAMAFIASTDMIFCFVLKLFLEERAEGGARGQRARAIWRVNAGGRGEVIVTARVPARCRRSTDDATGLQSPVERAIGHRAALRDPIFFARRSTDRSLPPNGVSKRGVAQQREDASQSLGYGRHRASRTSGAGVSTHLVGCSTKCAARSGRPGEEKLVSCWSIISIPPLNETRVPNPDCQTAKPRKNLNRANRIDFPPRAPYNLPRCTFLSIYGL